MMPLTMLNVGETDIIKKVGGKEEIKRFLENLGFVPGDSVTVLSDMGGNLIVNVRIPELRLERIWQIKFWFSM